jgi:hypothetical protein
MALNYRGRLIKKCKQANSNLRRAMYYLAEVEKSLRPQHPDRSVVILNLIEQIDQARHNLVVYTLGTFSRGKCEHYTRRTVISILKHTHALRRRGQD